MINKNKCGDIEVVSKLNNLGDTRITNDRRINGTIYVNSRDSSMTIKVEQPSFSSPAI